MNDKSKTQPFENGLKESLLEERLKHKPKIIFLKPVLLISILLVVIFLTEAIIMLVIEYLQPLDIITKALIDALALAVILFPTLYLLVFRPTRLYFTERRKTEDRLKESEESFKLMMHQSPSVIELYGLDGLQIDVNSAYEDLWGFPAGHTVNKFNVLKSKEVEESGLMSYVKDAYAGKTVKVPEYKFDSTGATEGKGKGRIRWLSTRIYPLKDIAGNVKNIVVTHEDISEIKFAEEERKQLEQVLLDIEERERKRIGYDLHDGLGQLLTGISFKLASLVGKLKGSSKGEAEDIADVLGIINDAKTHVAQLSRGLLPLELESEGIVSAIEKLASYAEKTLGISSAVRCSESFTINNEKAVLHLYRIAQEAVNNAVKHSNARHIEINLEKKDVKVELSIKDNGTGIPEKLDTGKGMGLQIMQYRADMIGALFDIQSSGDEGTMIKCIFNDIS
jgi:PAS domain S-box-containing protein